MRELMFDYTGTTALTLRSAEIPGVVALQIHTSETSIQALLDPYALMDLRDLINEALERTEDK